MAKAIIFNPVYPDATMEDQRPKQISADPAIFENVFKTHFKNLHSYAYAIIRNEADAEEIVQNVFYKIWEKKLQLSIDQSLVAYLYRSVYNESLNYLKHARVKDNYKSFKTRESNGVSSNGDSLIIKELRLKIENAISELPEQCRTIFQMSRYEGLRYREIASRLRISEKTVENQMGKALKSLKNKLLDYLPAVILFVNLKSMVI